MTEQRYDTTAAGANAPNPVPTNGQYDYRDPSTASKVDRYHTTLGAGAGLGAASAGTTTYAGSKHGDTQNLPLHQKQDFATSGQPGSVTQFGPTQGTVAPQNTHTQDPLGHQRYDSVIDPPKQHHDKRDAALLGTAGAAAAGGAAYEHSQHQEAERERERLEKEQEKQLKREAHDREKEQHKLEKEQKKREKEEEKEQHRLEKEQHKREKEEEKEARRLSKIDEGEKKGGILGFLHRDKSKKEKKSPESSPRESKEYAAAGTAGALGADTAAATHSDENDPNSPRWKGKNLLHKDLPPGHPAREVLDRPEEGRGETFTGKRGHIGIDGPIGHPDLISGDRETRKGVFGAHEIGDVHSKTIIEPHTSLSMDVGKFGTGTGGTDGNPAIEGYHVLPGTGTETSTATEGHHHVPGTGPATGTGVGTGVGHTTTEREVI